MKRCMFTIGAAVAAALVQAAVSVETFESNAGTWTGGTLTAGGPATAPANGYAVTDATHGQVLAIDGTATSSVGATGNALVDILFQVSIPEVAPALPSGEYFAIAVATDGSLVAFTNSTAEAVTIDADTHSKGEWIRVTTLFDYTNNRCQVALNGELACGGAWLPIALSSLSGIDVKGETAIDDVVIQNEASTVYDKYAAVTTTGAAAVVAAEGGIVVPVNYLSKQNVAQTDAGANSRADGGVLTYAEAYQAGVEPTEAFAITAAEPSANGIVLTFPGSWPADSYTVTAGTAPTALSGAQLTPVKDGNVNKVTLPLPADGVLYYKVGR